MSQKKKKKGWRWGEEGERETQANFQKEKKKNLACLWTRWSRGAGAQGRSGVSARRRGTSNEKMSGRQRSFTNCTPSSPTFRPPPPLREPFPRFLPPLYPHWLASQCLTGDGEAQVSLGVLSATVCRSPPEALQGSLQEEGAGVCSQGVCAWGGGRRQGWAVLPPLARLGRLGGSRQLAEDLQDPAAGSIERPGGGGCFLQLRIPGGCLPGEERSAGPCHSQRCRPETCGREPQGTPGRPGPGLQGRGGEQGWSGRRTPEPYEGGQCGCHVKPSQTRPSCPVSGSANGRTSRPGARRAPRLRFWCPLLWGSGNAGRRELVRWPARGGSSCSAPPSPATRSPGVVWKRGFCASRGRRSSGGGEGVCALLAGPSWCPLSAAGHFDHGPLAPAHPHLPGRRVLAVGGMPSSSIPEAFSELQQKALLI